ncbi:MAG: hypothetical protein JO270_23185, partial [Acidobacteriaceae bacterium]|nr:hypothetical protein [Acidobacteriaceae bacterium]
MPLLLTMIPGIPLIAGQTDTIRSVDDVTFKTDGVRVTSSQRITPLAAPGSYIMPLATALRTDENANGGYAVTSALSPDETILLVLTSGSNTGYNKEDGTPTVYPVLDRNTGTPTTSTTSNAEWVFVYDVTVRKPILPQKIKHPHYLHWPRR